ncbi:MAG: hypothetical protein A3K19_06915 [Lentisphaerae bacterium RIFOXYB12_FULL_65_16]|nr:MAG: hypothetical protein A3K19_06915 [Lentisphaerae bacterium RIFOXYB12_FULL_65_16]
MILGWVLVPLGLLAGDWEFSVGANVRVLDDVDLKGMSLNGGGYVDGSVTAIGGGLWRYTVKDPLNQVAGASLDEATYRTVTVPDATDDMDLGVGIALGASRALWTRGATVLGLELTAVTAASDADTTVTARQTLETWSIAADTWNPGGVPDPGTLSKVSANHVAVASPDVLNSVARVGYDVDLGLYTFGTGLTLRHQISKFCFGVATGPTFSVVDYDFQRDSSVTWLGGDTFYTERQRESGLAVRAGWYARGGIGCALTEAIGLDVHLRYDFIPVDVGSDVADIGLSGLGGQVSVTLRF